MGGGTGGGMGGGMGGGIGRGSGGGGGGEADGSGGDGECADGGGLEDFGGGGGGGNADSRPRRDEATASTQFSTQKKPASQLSWGRSTCGVDHMHALRGCVVGRGSGRVE